jgi:predicted GTPase
MSYGAGYVAARKFSAAEVVDPRPYAVGDLKSVFASSPHLKDVLPAMGYGQTQVRELEETINRSPCDVVVVGTPVDLGRLISCDKRLIRVSYELDERGTRALSGV